MSNYGSPPTASTDAIRSEFIDDDKEYMQRLKAERFDQWLRAHDTEVLGAVVEEEYIQAVLRKAENVIAAAVKLRNLVEDPRYLETLKRVSALYEGEEK